MNRDAYLNPNAVISFASTAGRILDDHIEVCRSGSEVFSRVAGMSSFQGAAATAIKAQFRDFLEIFDLYISSAKLVKSGIDVLNGSVGDEILDGTVIMEGIDCADRAYTDHINESIAYRAMSCRMTEPSLTACRIYFNHVSDIYAEMAENDKKLAEKWRDKAESYDRIEENTAGIFGKNIAVINKIFEGIDVISVAYAKDYYDSGSINTWKNELTKVIYDSYRIVEKDGSFRINWLSVEASLNKPSDHITEAEYSALAWLYTEMDTEDLGRFLGLLTNQGDRVDNYNKRMSAYAGNYIYEDYSEWIFDEEKLLHIGGCVYYEKEQLLTLAEELYNQASVTTDLSVKQQMYNEADSILAQRTDLYKRYLILNLCEDLSSVRGSYQADGPDLSVDQDVHGQYTFKWKNEGNIGQRLETGKDIYTELASDYAEISTYDGFFMSMYGDEVINETILNQVDRSDFGSVLYDFTNGQIKSEATGAVMDEIAKKLTKEWVSDIPVFDVLEIPFSLYSEYKENEEYLNNTGQSIRISELSNIYSAFDFEGGYVCIHGDQNAWMLQFQEGVRSNSLIDQINDMYYYDHILDINDFRNEPEYVLKKIQELMEESNDFERIRIDGILSGDYK